MFSNIYSWKKSYINLGQTVLIIYYTVSFDKFLLQKFLVFSFRVSHCWLLLGTYIDKIILLGFYILIWLLNFFGPIVGVNSHEL